jgi:hypothetical protein
MINNEYAEPIGQHQELNPKLWDQDQLQSHVRGALLRIAEDFLKFVDIPVEVVDIRLSGGNANYNYSEYSDIDLHVIADFSQVDCDREVAELFDTKRLLYKRLHTITISGIPVELYIEDQDHPAVSAAYSVVKDQWIKEPGQKLPQYDENAVKTAMEMWHKLIKTAIMSGNLSTCRKALSLLRKYRKMGLKTPEGEFSTANLAYKSLRNDHTIEGIVTLINLLHDRSLSIGG